MAVFIDFFFNFRWLLSTGRIEEAKKVANKFAKSHGTKLSDDDWNHVVKIETEGVSY